MAVPQLLLSEEDAAAASQDSAGLPADKNDRRDCATQCVREWRSPVDGRSWKFFEIHGRFGDWGRITMCMDDGKPRFELSEPDFLVLLVKHEPVLRAYARCLVPGWDLVDEALQEASVTMWQKRDQLTECIQLRVAAEAK